MTWRALSGVVGLLMFAATPALAQPFATTQSASAAATVPSSDPALISELKQLQSRLQQVRDLTTDFTQEKHTPLLRKPLVSIGEIRILGDVMRWHTRKPAESIMWIGGSEIRLYYPKQKLMEVYPLDQQLARLAASPIPRIDAMQEHFAFERADIRELDASADSQRYLALRLIPRQESLKEHIDEVRLLIDRETAYLRQMEMLDADGDRTVIRFEDVRMNTGLSGEDVELKTPAGTRISRPLSGEQAQ